MDFARAKTLGSRWDLQSILSSPESYLTIQPTAGLHRPFRGAEAVAEAIKGILTEITAGEKVFMPSACLQETLLQQRNPFERNFG